MKAPFSYEKRLGPYGGWEFRVADANDDRVATCWDEQNAKEIVRRLNAGADLLAALEAAYDALPAGEAATTVMRAINLARHGNPAGPQG